MIITSYHNLRPRNWLIDITEDNYCVVKSISIPIVVESFTRGNYNPQPLTLKGVRIIRDNLSLAGFIAKENVYKRVESGIILSIRPLPENQYQWIVDGQIVKTIETIHELQNSFEDVTGKMLEINLFGSKFYD